MQVPRTAPAALDDGVPAPSWCSKRTLILVSHAMERAFSTRPSTDAAHPGLVISLFQRREYFDKEASRYAALAAAGHTVVVGLSGSVADLPSGVHGVSFPEDDPRARLWGLHLVGPHYATSLVASDRSGVAPGELTLEASRLFDARWTFQRHQALRDARDQLELIRASLPPDVQEAALGSLAACEASVVCDAEARVSAAADHLSQSLDAGQRRLTSLRTELAATTSKAEQDPLTGLANRHYLERFLGGDDRPADLLTMLVDVDDLKAINDTWGHAAGDAALTAIAKALMDYSRPNDVVVRWGGDEFLVLVPSAGHTGGPAALAMGERLAVAVRGTRPAAPWAHMRLSVSIGVCPSRRTALPLADLDAALRQLKSAGKGHAALAPTTASQEPVLG